MKNNKSIAFISTMGAYPWGGSEELWSDTASLALDKGYDVIVLVYDWGTVHPKIQKLIDKGAKLFLKKRPVVTTNIFFRIKSKITGYFNRKIIDNGLQDIINLKPDIICISNGWTYQTLEIEPFFHLLIKNKIRYFILNQFHEENGAIPSGWSSKMRHIFLQAEHIFFVSKRNQEVCERQIFTKLDNAEVVYNPVNISSKELVKFPTFERGVKFACVARLDCSFKGQDILLHAFSKIRFTENWELNIYGKGPDEIFLKNLAKHLGLTDNVFFHDHVNDIRKVWKNNHILILPSIGEGTPLSLVEAMYCGRPSIVTNVGGNAEYIIENQTGFLIPGISTELFQQKISNALEQLNEWREIGEKANIFVTKKNPDEPVEEFFKKLVKL